MNDNGSLWVLYLLSGILSLFISISPHIIDLQIDHTGRGITPYSQYVLLRVQPISFTGVLTGIVLISFALFSLIAEKRFFPSK